MILTESVMIYLELPYAVQATVRWNPCLESDIVNGKHEDYEDGRGEKKRLLLSPHHCFHHDPSPALLVFCFACSFYQAFCECIPDFYAEHIKNHKY